jgi:hypothetical protein
MGEHIMTFSQSYQKEIWSINKIIEELHYNLISTIDENGLRKYEEMARSILYKIPIYKNPNTGISASPAFVIELQDISEKVKEEIANVPNKDQAKAIVVEAISQLFENLGSKEKEYYNKNVRHLLKVEFVKNVQL